LFEQNRREVSSYVSDLVHPQKKNENFVHSGGKLVASGGDQFLVHNNVIDLRASSKDSKWDDLNEYLVNYQKFLTPYTLLNSLSIYNYIGERTGLNTLKNANVIDVGAGTGQVYGTFFYHQESVNYFLLDPNLRLIHDQFLRLYPKMAHYPLAHILCFAEDLPFKNDFADLVMSFSSIDHFKNYHQFISESFRVLKPGGHVLIASHLDGQIRGGDNVKAPKYLAKDLMNRSFYYKVFNRLALKFEFLSRKYHNKKRGKVEDDHMHHFEDTKVLEQALEKAGFKVEMAEVFRNNFFIKAAKPR